MAGADPGGRLGRPGAALPGGQREASEHLRRHGLRAGSASDRGGTGAPVRAAARSGRKAETPGGKPALAFGHEVEIMVLCAY